MRILVAHKFFFPNGSIERHLFDLRALPQRHGHQVVDFSMADPRNLPSPYAHHFVSQQNFDRAAGGAGLSCSSGCCIRWRRAGGSAAWCPRRESTFS